MGKYLAIITTMFLLADSAKGLTVASFEEMIKDAQKICANLQCENSSVRVSTLSESEKNNLSKDLIFQLSEVSNSLVNETWSDTISGGGLVASDDTVRLQNIQFVTHNDELIGYRVTYSAKAYNADNCSDYNKLETCEKGSIFESAFVSIDFFEQFTDLSELAHFIQD